MRGIFQTRIFHWKKQLIPIIFWLILPVIGTIFIMYTADLVKEDAKAPVGIVLEENTENTAELVESIKESPLIHVSILPMDQAMYQLEKQELDSVFIIPEDYEEKIREHDRHQLLESYYTELSFAYPTIKEIIVSFVQQETGRSKAAQVVDSLAMENNQNKSWTWKEIVNQSKIIQKEQDLVHTSFAFYTSDQKQGSEPSGLNSWNVWAIIAFLSTFLLFDWPSKEAHSKVRIRFPFFKQSMKQYLAVNLLLYIALFIIIDLLTIGVFNYLFNEPLNFYHLGVVITYRLMITQAAFLLSLSFKRVYSYYLLSVILFLFLTIGSGGLLPLDGLAKYSKLLVWMNPLYAFIGKELTVVWLLILTFITCSWYMRKESYHV